MVVCLECGANDLHMVQLMPLPPIISCFSKIQSGLPFWYWLTQVVLEQQQHNNRFTALLGYVRDHPGEQAPER